MVWMNATYSKIFYERCPKAVNITLEDPDVQCALNRSDMLSFAWKSYYGVQMYCGLMKSCKKKLVPRMRSGCTVLPYPLLAS